MDPENQPCTHVRGKPIRALVVDDNFDIAHLMADILGKVTDVDVVAIALGGEPGLELATSCQVDLVLTDMEMPGVNGLRLASLLRERFPGICIILTTAHSTDWREPALAAGADSFIPKPDLVNRLADEIGRLRKEGLLGTRTKDRGGDRTFRSYLGGRPGTPPHPRR